MNDDPRKLRNLLERAFRLAADHDVGSVMVGLAAEPGDLRFPDFVDYLLGALRVEDGVFRMTRERVVLHLADVDRAMATEVIERLHGRFDEEFPAADAPHIDVRYVEMRPGDTEPSVKAVLPSLFGADPEASLH